jgi:hypothetical protein
MAHGPVALPATAGYLWLGIVERKIKRALCVRPTVQRLCVLGDRRA